LLMIIVIVSAFIKYFFHEVLEVLSLFQPDKFRLLFLTLI